MLLIHGFTGSSLSWGDRLIDGLVSAGRSPILFDLPGHGRHAGDLDPAHYTLEHVDAELVRAVTPVGSGPVPVDVVGYSMGGRLALAFAVRHPELVTSLVLESASAGLETTREREARLRTDEALAQRLERDGIEAFVDLWESHPFFASRRRLSPEVRALHRGLRLRNDPRSLAASLRGLGAGSLASFWDDLPGLDIPTLLIVGEEDTKFVEVNRRMAERLPDVRLAVAAAAGHTVHLEQPEAWLEAVVGFLSGG